MVARIRLGWSVFSAGAVAGILAVALALAAAGIGWLVGSPVLAGSLAMIVSAVLIIGFGGMPWWAVGLVGLSWGFTDTLLSAVGMAGTTGHVTMAAAYFMLGMTQGKTRSEVLYAGAGPMLGSVLGIGLAAVVFPQQTAQGIEEAVLSAGMISAARSARGFVAVLRSRGRPEQPGRAVRLDAGRSARTLASGADMGLREEVADLLAELDGPMGEDALCALTSRREALPFVADAYHRESNAKRRQSLIHCLWQYHDVAVLPTLRMALRDPDERVWQEALDGFVALGGDAVQRALEEERAALSQDAKAKVKREWVDEAIEQMQGSADPG